MSRKLVIKRKRGEDKNGLPWGDDGVRGYKGKEQGARKLIIQRRREKEKREFVLARTPSPSLLERSRFNKLDRS